MRRILLTAFLALWALPIWAQENVELERMDFYKEMFNVVRDKLFPRLIDRLPHSERQKLSDIGIRFIPDPMRVADAFTRQDKKEIYIAAGFIDGLFEYADCLLMTYPKAAEHGCYKYFEYYFDHLVLKCQPAPLSFAKYVLVEDEKAKAWHYDERMIWGRKLMLMSALAFVVMHEMGHHVVGFAGPGTTVSQHRDLELRADRWAIDRLTELDENPVLGAVVALGYVSQMEKFRRIKGVTTFSLHYKPRIRARYAYEMGCANLTGDKAAKVCAMLSDFIDTFE